jgi:hypothetical protein
MDQKGECPSARSGHSFTWIGGYNYLLYGGIEDAKNGKIAPSSDLYTMKLGPSKYFFPLFSSIQLLSPWISEKAVENKRTFLDQNSKKRFHIFNFENT